MISGAIDNVAALSSGGYRVGGWAIFRKSGIASSVESISVTGLGNVKALRSERQDISHTGQFGFYLDLPDSESLGKLYFGAIFVSAASEGQILKLEIWTQLRQNFMKHIAEFAIGNLTADVFSEILGSTNLAFNSEDIPANLDHESISVDVGSLSFDGSTIVGKQGHLFLYKGSNSVQNQYFLENHRELSQKWISLIEERRKSVEAIGSTFFQIIVPEKQSILFSLYPPTIPTPTPTLAGISAELNGVSWFLNVYESLAETFKLGLHPFRRVDTHLSFFGASTIVQDFLQRIGSSINISQPLLKEYVISGDLGEKLVRGKAYETILAPDLEQWDFANLRPETTRSVDSPNNHIGTVREWRCENALLDSSVLIFGNSMCERGGEPYGLSWWFSRIFREATFVWSPVVDLKLIEAKRPDIVVAQTVERFLQRVPDI